jgi:enolase
MTARIASVDALEILDSRGNPTVRVVIELDDGVCVQASVPSGASTGEHEAIELRDGDRNRYGGKGTLRAVENVRRLIGPQIVGLDPTYQAEIDGRLIDLDGTEDKSRIGANAILGVSMAVARAGAHVVGQPLYAYLGGPGARRLPVPMMNVINGGSHADNALDFQEFMLVPHGAPRFAEALRYGAEIFHALKLLLGQRGYATSVGDEGGFAPKLKSNEEACKLIVESIETAGFIPGEQVAIALDPAASSFAVDGGYAIAEFGDDRKSHRDMTELYRCWLDKYPIVSIEDGLGENDWVGFREHTATLGKRVQIVGDDIYVTNTKFIERGIIEGTTNAVLIKLNQIGTVTETMNAIGMCRTAGWGFIVSHRSGETEDTFIADLAVAMGGGQIKAGSLCRSDRVSKYNRLLEIEHVLGDASVFYTPFRTPDNPHSSQYRGE